MIYDSSVSNLTENGKKISLINITFPKYMEQIFVYLLSMVHTLMLSGYSGEAVAATNVANQVYVFALLVSGFIAVGVGVILSIAIGEENAQKINEATGTGIWTSAGIGGAIAVVLAIAAPAFISLMNLEGETGKIATNYLCIKTIAIPMCALNSCFNQMLMCRGYAKLTLVSGIATNILNVVTSYIILYSGIDLPVEGASGLAVGFCIVTFVGMVISYYFCVKKGCIGKATFKKSVAFEIFRIGFPGTMNSMSYNIAQIISTGFIASMGIAIINTKVYASSIVNYVYAFSLSLAQANRVIMGIYRGRREFDNIKKLHRQNVTLCLLCNVSMSLLIYIFRNPIVSIFTSDPAIARGVGIILLIDIVVEIPRAANHIYESSHIANGDVGATFWISFISCWAFSIPFGYLLGIKLGFGIEGIWIAYVLEESFKAIAYAIRWKKESWRYTRI